MLLVSVIRKWIGYPKIVKILMLGNSCVTLCHPENIARSGAPYLSQEAGDSRHQSTSIRSMPLIDKIYECVRAICLFLRPSFYFNRRLRNEHVSSYSYSKMGNATVTYLPLEDDQANLCSDDHNNSYQFPTELFAIRNIVNILSRYIFLRG